MTDLPAIVTKHRVTRARAAMAAAEVDGLIVTNLVNVRWLTGFTGSAGLVALTRDDLLLVTDGRYSTQAPDQIAAAKSGARIEITRTEQRERVVDTVGDCARVGLEADHISWGQANAIINQWLPETEVVETSEMLVGLRAVKDGAELTRMRRAASITDEALATIAPQLLEHPTEIEFGLALDFEIRRRGAAGSAFETIVASGANAAKPHHRPSVKRIADGELVIIDVGAIVDGYRSDMTRTFAVGELSATQLRMYDTVIAAQQAGVDTVASGVTTRDVDTACRTVITDADWGAAFSHGTGHGVGLDIHELPRLASTSDDVLATAQVVTVEPGVYLPEHGGVRIEDSLVVTDAGSERLTNTVKTLDPRALR